MDPLLRIRAPFRRKQQPWWVGRCREIADYVNLMANPPKELEVTAWQVEQVLLAAEKVRGNPGPRRT